MKKYSAFFLVLLMSTSFLRAEEKINCDEPSNQHEMNYCAYILYEAADVKLNETYKKVQAAELADDAKSDKEQKEKLKESQKAWVGFKTKFCEVQAYAYSGTGSMYALDLYTCLKDLTNAQVKNLESLAN